MSCPLFLFTGTAQQQHEAIGKTDAHHQHCLQNDAHGIIGDGHAVHQQGDPQNVDKSGDSIGGNDALQLIEACEAPNALIQLEAPEEHQTKSGIKRDEALPGAVILLGDEGEAAVKAKPKRDQKRDADTDRVVQQQKSGNDLPMGDQRFMKEAFRDFFIHEILSGYEISISYILPQESLDFNL